MAINTIGVIGSGQMGNGIAQVAAAAGLNVIMSDIKQEFCQKGVDTIAGSLARLVKKEKITAEDQEAILGRIKTTTDLKDMAGADIVVEAATENVDLKLDIFRQLDSICPANVILSSNTSSISITKIAGVTKRPEQVIGMHFMNPVPMMKLVEVIRGLATSEETFEPRSWIWPSPWARPRCRPTTTPVSWPTASCMPMINEAIYCVVEGVGKPEDIDTDHEAGHGPPHGPLGPGRPHRPGHLPGHHGGAVPGP